MPFYEYECGACGHRIEALQKISDDPLVYCPECNEARLKKLISAAGFRLKGTGWYETDFKSSEKKDSSKETKGDSAPDKSASGKSNADKGGTSSADAGGKTESSKPAATSKDSGQGASA